jgi:protein-disulfide isomerase
MSLLLAALLSAVVTADQAKQIVPRADLSGLTDEQRGVFVEVAPEVFNYAGCQDTLARCLAAGLKDPHALRMAELIKQLAHEGVPATPIVQMVEKYYASFEPRQRLKISADNCPVLGKGPVALVEFSDYQCPHCAGALVPLESLVEKERKGHVRLCTKYFPFPSHPRARIAALCAEYARSKGSFWEMNAALFMHQDALEDADLKKYAAELGLDGDEMLKEAYSGKFDAVIEKHIREGMASGVESTPALFFNGRMHSLPVRPWYLRFSADDELQWQKEKGWKFSAAAAPQHKKVKVAKGK